ncbi:hypothetical protein SNE40_005023 [Patella caerulea]|uniref:Potassium channel tetramerisation-type BTB domain-containing protein n=1 Tax=Patella caerulea TaxID=87958 RepID=A0AAN8JZ95_PATCE
MGDFIETSKFPAIIELNVGGYSYSTSLLTLTKNGSTMLGAMFSGKFDVQKDQNGKYFIDADGEMFSHILRYLRYSELPPYSLCEKVYKDACYFGINELVEELERTPPLVGRKMRERFRSRIKGYDQFVNELIKKITNINHLGTSTPISSLRILLFEAPNNHDYPDFDVNHDCFMTQTDAAGETLTLMSQVSLGPWSVNLDEDNLMKILIQDLEERRFVCNYKINGTCHYKCIIPRALRANHRGQKMLCCPKMFYTVQFHWTKM